MYEISDCKTQKFQSCYFPDEPYGKIPKFSDAKKLCCNRLKFKQRGQTLGYFVKMMQME